MNKNRHAWFVILPFFGILILFLCLGILLPDNAASTEESRSLTQKPVWDFSDMTALTENWSDYVVDQFPMRTRFLKAYSVLELAQGKVNTRNTYIASDDYLMTYIYKVSDGQRGQLVAALGNAAANSDADFVYTLLPQKNDALHPLIEDYLDNANSDENRQKLLAALAEKEDILVADVTGHFLDAYTLEELAGMYYKSDFHWNELGAYRAADFIGDTMVEAGVISDGAAEDDFVWSDLSETHTYQGDLNRRFSNLFSMEEDIPFYECADTENLKYYTSLYAETPVDRSTIVARGVGEGTLNYNTLSTDNLGYFRVENPNAKNDKCLLILKDSYQNPTIDYFTALYREVNVIDPRSYAEPLTFLQLLEERGVDTVLFMYHQNNASAELISFLNKQ